MYRTVIHFRNAFPLTAPNVLCPLVSRLTSLPHEDLARGADRHALCGQRVRPVPLAPIHRGHLVSRRPRRSEWIGSTVHGSFGSCPLTKLIESSASIAHMSYAI